MSDADVRVCAECGSPLSDKDKTDKRPPLRPSKSKLPQVEGSRTVPDGSTGEQPQLQPGRVRATGMLATGPRPAAQPAPRKSNPVAKPIHTPAGGTGARDALIGQKLQEYVIQERIGVGGMGNVYRAVQPMIGKNVAIKVLRADVVTDPRDIDRLLDEARVVNSIKHRGIINIFGAGTLPDGRHYLIMELLEGESLEQLMQRDGTVPAADAVVILDEVLSALAAAHAAGIVHRDLKPANVFLVKEGGKFYVKLLDFGLARRSQSQNVTRIAGTPDYISPEHARGRPAGPPADLYAFGVLCFHMLTGRLPFIGTTPMEVMEQHVHSPPPVPHELNPAIPKALSELILKLLGKDPTERPDAPQVRADLRAATKQLRNAATMMSLASIEQVPETPEQEKRARALAVEAQITDLKRNVTRRWPYLAGGFVGLWLLGVVVYSLWPSSEVVKPVKKTGTVVIDDPLVKPQLPDAHPLLAVVPEVDAGQAAEIVPPAADAEVAVAIADVADGGEPLVEDRNAPLDDLRLFEMRKKFDEPLEGMQLVMKKDSKKRLIFREYFDSVKKKITDAKTINDMSKAEDDLNDLQRRFYGQ